MENFKIHLSFLWSKNFQLSDSHLLEYNNGLKFPQCHLLFKIYKYFYCYLPAKVQHIFIIDVLNLHSTKNYCIPFCSWFGVLEGCGQFTPTMRQQCHLIYAMTSLRRFSPNNRRIRIITKNQNNWNEEKRKNCLQLLPFVITHPHLQNWWEMMHFQGYKLVTYVYICHLIQKT